jgi:hypothetical protein
MNSKVNLVLVLLLGCFQGFAQRTEEELKELSAKKWTWMAEKNVDKLAPLFHDKSKFLHMSGTWNKDAELEIIKTGSIWYKKATVHDVAVAVTGNTAVVWSRITLESQVRGNDALVEFTVTEVFVKEAEEWQILALSFSSVRDQHKLQH